MVFKNYCSYNRTEDLNSPNFTEGIFPISILYQRIKLLQNFDSWIPHTLPNSFSSDFKTSWKYLTQKNGAKK